MMDGSSLEKLQNENEELKKRLGELEERLQVFQNSARGLTVYNSDDDIVPLAPLLQDKLTKEHVSRFSRQLLMEEIGVQGQLKLLSSSVLIVGAGGLGSPVALYLAGAGIGRLGIVDYDLVESSNLHRQVIHSQLTVGEPKSLSACNTIRRFNSGVDLHAYNVVINRHNAMKIAQSYDLIVDASDNVATRYLLNDISVLLKKPLVSGSALRGEGQVTVYNYKSGPCYRCLFPSPPPPETVTRCANGGVLGPVPGTVGCIQSMEVIKIVTGAGNVMSQKMLLIDAFDTRYTVVKLRGRDAKCAVCGDSPSVTQLIDYEQFCGAKATDVESSQPENLGLNEELIISWEDYHVSVRPTPHILLDVRGRLQYAICSIPNSENIPLKELSSHIPTLRERSLPIYTVCRRGNDSQLAAKKLAEEGLPVRNIRGGLRWYARDVDPSFPMY